MDVPHSAFLDSLHSSVFTTTGEDSIPFIIGKGADGNVVIKDFSSLSHLLIAGATGTGKSTLAHGIILSLISKTSPDNLKILLCDTKVVEFGIYHDIPHLLGPSISDPVMIGHALAWVLAELNRRLHLINKANCRSIDTYNELCSEEHAPKLPRILLAVDDIAKAIGSNSDWDILRQIAQNGRASGIHLLLITQTPGDKKLADIIRSSIPARAVFNVFSNTDEKLLLGAAKNAYLSDVGEIIFCVMPGRTKEKIYCYPIADSDISTAISEIKSRYIDFVSDPLIWGSKEPDSEPSDDEATGDEMLPVAVDVILETKQASVSILQRRLKLGYARAARIIDEMEERGIIGPFVGSSPRQILITKDQWEKLRTGEPSQPHTNDISLAELPTYPASDDSDPAIDAAPTSIKKTPSPSIAAYHPKPAARRPAPAESKHMNKFEQIAFFCGCILLLGCFLGDFKSPSDRLGLLVFGLGACIFAKVRSIRWITISVVFGLSGLTAIPRIWDNGHLSLASFLTVCLCLGISIVYGKKATGNYSRNHFRFSSTDLKEIDAMTGAEFEEYTAQLLRRLGYTQVSVTPLSGDQGIDVLAQTEGIRYAIQCKNYHSKLGNTPVQEAFAGKTFYDCDVAVVLTNSTFTDGAFELAESTGVQLWDRETLYDMIQHAK